MEEKKRRPTVGMMREMEKELADARSLNDAVTERLLSVRSELEELKSAYDELHEAWMLVVDENERLMKRPLWQRIINK